MRLKREYIQMVPETPPEPKIVEIEKPVVDPAIQSALTEIKAQVAALADLKTSLAPLPAIKQAVDALWAEEQKPEEPEPPEEKVDMKPTMDMCGKILEACSRIERTLQRKVSYEFSVQRNSAGGIEKITAKPDRRLP